MTDLETRLTEGLTGTAGRAPHPSDLAAGARVRLRLRRRTTTAVVAAVMAVVAIPVGITLLSGPGDRSTVSEEPDGWRTETWRDLSVSVPPEWEPSADWCGNGQDPQSGDPHVTRPPGPELPVSCSPAYGYGLHFVMPSSGELPPGTEGTVQQYHGDRYPDGAWIGYASTEQSAVWVVSADRTTARQVLDSAEPVAEVDANGCASQAWRWRPSDTERVSVCRYATDGWLEQSELLSAEDSRAAGSALQSAPPARGVSPRCSASYPARPVVTMSAAGFSARLFSGRGCGIASVFSDGSGTGAMVTEDVLFWALSPGWPGSADLGVPLPERLRRR